jgi:hypothetical protein
MSSLRTVFGIVVLAAILYAVYVSITKPKNDAPPPEVANGLAPPPQGEILPQAIPQFPQNPGGTGAYATVYPPPTSGSAYPSVGAAPAAAQQGGSPWSTPGPGMNGTPAAPDSAASSVPPSPSQSLPGFPAVSPTTPGVPSGSSMFSPSPSPSAMTANPAARSPMPYPSTNLPEVPGSGVMPATSIDSGARPFSANAGSTRLPDPGGSSPPSGANLPEFTALLQAVYANIAKGNFAASHAELSRFYGEPHLTATESRALLQLLDQLAGTVIYSRQHLLEPAYKVQSGDTLERIARYYDVSPSLLAKINGIRDPMQLQPGMELKVLRGPFDAVIDLGRYEMTLLLKDRYAGRFTIGVGRDHPQLEGQYTVRDKQFSPVYYGPDPVTISPSDPRYPLGKRWIDLGSQNGFQIGIHGTNDPRNIGHTSGRGSILLGERDIDDVYDILTVGSKVTIRR